MSSTATSDAAFASAGNLNRISEVQVRQHRAIAARLSAEERDPWHMRRSDNEASIYNYSSTPKYHVKVAIRLNDDDGDEGEIWGHG